MKHGLADSANKVMLVEAVAIRAPKAYSSSSSGTGWQSQNATDPSSKRGDDIIRHAALGIDIHLFVRDSKLAAGKACLTSTILTARRQLSWPVEAGNEFVALFA